jgi:hypothetical protein
MATGHVAHTHAEPERVTEPVRLGPTGERRGLSEVEDREPLMDPRGHQESTRGRSRPDRTVHPIAVDAV